MVTVGNGVPAPAAEESADGLDAVPRLAENAPALRAFR